MKNLIKKLTSKPKLISFLTSMFFTMLLFSISSRNTKYGTIAEMWEKGEKLEKAGKLTDEVISISFNLGAQITLLLMSIIVVAFIIIQAIYNNNNQKLFGILLGILVFLILPSGVYVTIIYAIIAVIFYILNELPKYKKTISITYQLKTLGTAKLIPYDEKSNKSTLESKTTTPDDFELEVDNTKEELENPFTSTYQVTNEDANEDAEVTRVHENLTQKVKEASKTEDVLPESPKRKRGKNQKFSIRDLRIGDKLPLEFLKEHKDDFEYSKLYVVMAEDGTRYKREYKITWDEYGVVDDFKTIITKDE